jgi:cell wall-associated NlpC family hydrolase
MRCGPRLAPVRVAPDESAEQVTELLPGEPVDLVAAEGAWVRVITAYGYPGWVASDALEEGDGEVAADALGPPLEVALEYLGAPYLWGGLTEAGIDCSGLVHMSYRRIGRLVPRDARDQDAAALLVPDPAPGDLATYGDPVDHVAFWLGDGAILHAAGREGVRCVVVEPEPDALRRRRRGFRRL